ncbi:hypothetical protein PTQ21_12885 [Paenibacillus marchantiae]|uniref:hypothetical protein n=1 Tax=Paenibacillus marchantiae TaxID=3026433 RepID=UPI00237AA254|nr:hypothetical protein [Paenibacillus marchantiae]WDQ35069.1 hypothetical protein PTQ21_12885 [Paenibacillus marchantiae]
MKGSRRSITRCRWEKKPLLCRCSGIGELHGRWLHAVGEAPCLCRSGAITVSTAVVDAVQSREVLLHWEQHLILTRLATAQAALRFTFYQNIYVPKASEGLLIP